MANYIGNQPSAGEFKHLDSITSQFNGSSVTFALKFNAVSQSIGDASQLIVSLNGVIQEPLTAYTLGTGGSTITFASAPQSGDTCFIVMLGGVGGTATPTDGSVTTAKIASGAVTSSKISIDGDVSFPDDDKAVFGDGSDLQIYHNSSNNNSYISESGAGSLFIQGANIILEDPSTGADGIVVRPNAEVELYYQGSEKLATTNTGIDVTGITKSTTGFQFGATTSYLYESASDVVTLRVGSNGPYMRLGSDDGEIGNSSGSTRFIAGTGGAKILLDTNGKVGIGVDNFSVFNGVGGNSMLVIKGSNAATNIANNSNASITIANDDGTANNTAGLHFARADTDDNPHYAGASIVTQFTQAQVTGQYPKADLAFLTSTDANFAPSEKMRISADGNILVNTTDVDLGYTNGDTGVVLRNDGVIQAARDEASVNNSVLYVNKLNGEGKLIALYKSGTQAGNIGIVATNNIFMSSVDGVGIGVGDDNLYPTNSVGNSTNGVLDIGDSTARFKNAYFNGTVNSWTGVYAKAGTSVNLENAAGSANSSIKNAGAGSNTDLTITTGSTDRMRVNNDGTINTFSTVVGGYHYYTNSGTIDTDYLANSGYVFEIAGKVNPNSGGSTYVDPFLGHIYIGHGWNGSALTAYIYYVALQPAARDIFPSGSGFSGDALEVCFVSSGTEFTTIPVAGGSSYNIRVKALNYNSTYGSNFELHITRKA